MMREPSADVRQAAGQLRELYNALTMEGFSPQEALVIIGQMMAAGQNGQNH